MHTANRTDGAAYSTLLPLHQPSEIALKTPRTLDLLSRRKGAPPVVCIRSWKRPGRRAIGDCPSSFPPDRRQICQRNENRVRGGGGVTIWWDDDGPTSVGWLRAKRNAFLKLEEARAPLGPPTSQHSHHLNEGSRTGPLPGFMPVGLTPVRLPPAKACVCPSAPFFTPDTSEGGGWPAAVYCSISGRTLGQRAS